MKRYAGVHPDTSVYGLFECPHCQELRPIFDREQTHHVRIYRCSRCIDYRENNRAVYRVGRTTYMDHPMTFSYFCRTFRDRLNKQGELF
jgi:DNA-directed RNA polymerase subunit M/transcription elongation factor TFIIS